MITAFAATEAAKDVPHVSLPAEEVFSIAGFPITNSMILGVVGSIILLTMFLYVARDLKKGHTRNKFVLAVQWMYEILLGTVEQMIGDKVLARRLAPLAITLFFFIIANYWLGVLPGVGESITIHHDGKDVPLFRSLAADLNVTFALAIITMVTAQIYAFRIHGPIGNIKRYIKNPITDPTGAFEGILELIAEFSRLTALSLRLFGNVFAGEVLLLMVGYLTSFAAPLALPFFMLFELFMGGIQAYVFFMLTVAFVGLAVVKHDDHQPAPKKALSTS